jgi:hypothetical protein
MQVFVSHVFQTADKARHERTNSARIQTQPFRHAANAFSAANPQLNCTIGFSHDRTPREFISWWILGVFLDCECGNCHFGFESGGGVT